MLPACTRTVENLIVLGIMGGGGLMSLFVGGFLAGWLIGMRDPQTTSRAEHRGGCLLSLLCITGSWFFVCFPAMRFVLWWVCGKPFGFS